jgi:glycosyltransferase involved in cell wall biosynthesis
MQGVLKIGVLFSRLSGYMVACLNMLKKEHGVELLVFYRPPDREAPYETRHFEWIDHLYDRSACTPAEIQALVEKFEPDAVFMVGWADRGYLQVARALKKMEVPVIAGSDAQWEGSLKQYAGCVISPWYLHSAIDVLWAAGERQRQLANRLGFKGEQCWSGYYTCDWDRFAPAFGASNRPSASSFLFVGRYVPVKGLDILVEAYALYRSLVPDPWPLVCVGTGPKAYLLSGRKGIIDRGFVQPDRLPEVMAQSSALILPSRREPWGVAVHEAATAGLPLICSDACGAAVHLLLDQYNGYLFNNGDATHLARCMARLSEMPLEKRDEMGQRSHMISKQYTPRRWASMLMQGIESLTSSR